MDKEEVNSIQSVIFDELTFKSNLSNLILQQKEKENVVVFSSNKKKAYPYFVHFKFYLKDHQIEFKTKGKNTVLLKDRKIFFLSRNEGGLPKGNPVSTIILTEPAAAVHDSFIDSTIAPILMTSDNTKMFIAFKGNTINPNLKWKLRLEASLSKK